MTPSYFILHMASLLILISFILYKPLTTFYMTDDRPAIIPFMPKRQATGAEAAVPVQVGMLIQNFPTFDIIANSFVADLILWFEFDPSLITVETIQKFSFDRATILRITDADMKVKKNKLFVQYGIRLSFSTPLNHTLFPLNDHRLFLVLKNEYVSPDELLFEAPRSSFVVASTAHTSDWTIADRSTQTGYFKSKLDEFDFSKTLEYPAVVFAIDFAKKGFRKVFIIMLPLLILFIISAFTLLMNPDPFSRSILTLSSGTLTGVIAYRFVIEKIIPDVGYFTLTDHIFNLFLMGIFLIFVVNIFAVRNGQDDERMLTIKGATLLGILIILLGCIYYLIKG